MRLQVKGKNVEITPSLREYVETKFAKLDKQLADYVATRNVECIIDTMERLGIRYDLLARESDILHLHFWERAFELMKSAGVIGSWVRIAKRSACSPGPRKGRTPESIS